MENLFFEQAVVPAHVLSWYELFETYVKYNTIKSQSDFNNFKKAIALLNECFPDSDTANFGAKSLRMYQDFLIAKGYARTYINKLVNFLKSAAKWAVCYEQVSPNLYATFRSVPCVKCGRAKENPEREAVDDEIAELVLQYLPQVLQDMQRLERASGMRPSEICRMKVGFVQKFMQRDKSYWVCKFYEHKTSRFGKKKIVVLNETAIDILQPYVLAEH